MRFTLPTFSHFARVFLFCAHTFTQTLISLVRVFYCSFLLTFCPIFVCFVIVFVCYLLYSVIYVLNLSFLITSMTNFNHFFISSICYCPMGINCSYYLLLLLRPDLLFNKISSLIDFLYNLNTRRFTSDNIIKRFQHRKQFVNLHVSSYLVSVFYCNIIMKSCWTNITISCFPLSYPIFLHVSLVSSTDLILRLHPQRNSHKDKISSFVMYHSIVLCPGIQ